MKDSGLGHPCRAFARLDLPLSKLRHWSPHQRSKESKKAKSLQSTLFHCGVQQFCWRQHWENKTTAYYSESRSSLGQVSFLTRMTGALPNWRVRHSVPPTSAGLARCRQKRLSPGIRVQLTGRPETCPGCRRSDRMHKIVAW